VMRRRLPVTYLATGGSAEALRGLLEATGMTKVVDLRVEEPG